MCDVQRRGLARRPMPGMRVKVNGPLEICEGVSATWHYHLCKPGTFKALCGASVMLSHVPLDQWNKKIPNYHVPESFCQKCDGIKDEHEA